MIDQVAEGRPVRVAAPAVLEIVYGYQRMAPMISAFAAGLDVATENHRDFEPIGEALGALFPEAPALAVVDELPWA